MSEDRGVSHGLRVASQRHVFFFLQQNSRKAIFSLPVVNDNEIVGNMPGVEIRLILFGVLFSKLLVPTCFTISGYP